MFSDEFPIAPESKVVARFLAHINKNTESYRTLISAVQMLGLEFKSPAWQGEAAAHVTIPKHKLAILMTDAEMRGRDTKFHEEWKKHGWRMIHVDRRLVGRSIPDQVARGIESFLSRAKK